MLAKAFGRILLATICILIAYALVVTSNPRAEPKPDVPPNAVLGGLDGVFYERCPGAQRAITYYRRAYTWQRQQMNLTGAVPRKWYDCTVTLRRAVEWRAKFRVARDERRKWNRTVGHVVRRLNQGLAGTPMSGLGAELEAAGREYGVSPYFMAAAAGTESSFGAAACSNNHRNVWGLAACDGRWHVPYFNTWREAIRFYANFLSSRWPSASTPYNYYGYAACDACWGRKTSQHMGRFGAGTSTRYVTP